MPIDTNLLANEIADAYANRRILAIPPSARYGGFDLAAAYAVEAELTRRRRAVGFRTVGLKVGYANKAVWRALELSTLVWAHMYDDTVHLATGNRVSLSLARTISAKIEPEIVLALKRPLVPGISDPAAVLDAVESLALGFEIIDCAFADWKFRPPDFVAAYGLHAALIVGEPQPIDPARISALVEALAQFRVKLSKEHALIDEGSARNSLRSPALCLAELVAAVAKQCPTDQLESGDLVSTGTLTESKPIAPGETWSAAIEGLDLPALTVDFT
ncbi:MAG TPA: fumarylacetoacetate hydrolase family protein [Vicinamibacterales bacterium]|jgi:2-oxo-3-hexenedioate decarboxylase